MCFGAHFQKYLSNVSINIKVTRTGIYASMGTERCPACSTTAGPGQHVCRLIHWATLQLWQSHFIHVYFMKNSNDVIDESSNLRFYLGILSPPAYVQFPGHLSFSSCFPLF